jgi:hypothetical protein
MNDSQYHEDYMKNPTPQQKDKQKAQPNFDEVSAVEMLTFQLEVDQAKLKAESDLITEKLNNSFHYSFGTCRNMRKRKTAIKKELEKIRINLVLIKK